MIRQYRHPLRKVLLELPAGHIENNEDAEKTATRELLEETGYHAREIEEVYTYNPSVNISKQLIHVFRGRNLVKGEYKHDRDSIEDPARSSVTEDLMDATREPHCCKTL